MKRMSRYVVVAIRVPPVCHIQHDRHETKLPTRDRLAQVYDVCLVWRWQRWLKLCDANEVPEGWGWGRGRSLRTSNYRRFCIARLQTHSQPTCTANLHKRHCLSLRSAPLIAVSCSNNKNTTRGVASSPPPLRRFLRRRTCASPSRTCASPSP